MMNMMTDDDRYNARLDEIGEAIAVLARRKRRPQDLAVLIEAGDRKLEVLAGADRDELDDAGGGAALALGYVAGLALTLRQALRHHAGAHVVVRPRRGGGRGRGRRRGELVSQRASGERSIADIAVGKRHRRDLGDVRSLAASIADLGLLHPIVITPDGRLMPASGGSKLSNCSAEPRFRRRSSTWTRSRAASSPKTATA